MKSTNIPEVRLGIIAVSRDCFPIQLSQKRRSAIKAACDAKKLNVYEAQTAVENEAAMLAAVAEVKEAGCNALTVFLGNFGPETPETLIAKYFDGPCMFVAAAEGDGDMINGRGDAYCGMLNCSYNLGMRHLKGYIPEYPVGTAAEIADKMAEFIPIARAILGFHCGNTPSSKMCPDRAVKYQLIQHRLLEPAGSDPDFTRGTLEGDIAPGDVTFYRLQCDSDGDLRAYIAQGQILPVHTRSFGGIAIFDIPEMGRFYRHVLIQKRYPHHGAVAFGHYGKALFEVFKFLGIADIAYNQPKNLPYPTENPFA